MMQNYKKSNIFQNKMEIYFILLATIKIKSYICHVFRAQGNAFSNAERISKTERYEISFEQS